MEENQGSSLVRSQQADDKALIERGQCLKLQMLTSHNSQVSLLYLLFFFFCPSLFFYGPVCPHVQRCVATVCASMGANVGRDPPSFVTVLQGSTGQAASMVSRNILTVFHIQNVFCSLFFHILLGSISLSPPRPLFLYPPFSRY